MELNFTNLKMKSKFMVGSTFGIIILMGFVVLIIENRQSNTLLHQTEQRGLAIAKNIAAVSTDHLLSYNYIGLQQHADKAVREKDISYVAIFDKEHKVAAFSGRPDLQLQEQIGLLDSNRRDIRFERIHMIYWTPPDGKRVRVLDITAPVYIDDPTVTWGAVRIGLSLASMNQELFRTRLLLFTIGLVAVCISLVGAALLSSEITKPIQSLVGATRRAAQGDLQHRIQIQGHDELGQLGQSFNLMIENLGKRTQELIELKNHMDRIIESSPDAITVVDGDGRITIFNEAAENLTQYKAEEIIGRPVADFFSDAHEFETIQQLLLQKGNVRQYKTNIMNKKESSIPIDLSLALILDQENKPVGSVGIIRDLREMKQLQSRLFQSERLAATARLAASIAHEISNPIYGIQNCIDLLGDEIDSDNPRKQYLDLAKKEIERVATLVRQMVDFHRPIEEPFRPIQINLLLSEILALEEKRLRQTNIHVSCDYDNNLPPIRGAENQLKQVLYNIILNAREAMLKGGQLKISTQCEEEHVRIDISDTGKGISDEERLRIFEPFYTTKAKVKGVGLGLSVSYGIIQKHDGKIDVKSEPGQGTTFSVTLPIVATVKHDSSPDLHVSKHQE